MWWASLWLRIFGPCLADFVEGAARDLSRPPGPLKNRFFDIKTCFKNRLQKWVQKLILGIDFVNGQEGRNALSSEKLLEEMVAKGAGGKITVPFLPINSKF